MPGTSLDTHEIVKDLTGAGFTENQAEAVTRWVRRSQDLDLSSLATKSDLEVSLAATKADLQVSLATTKADLEVSLAATKADLQVSLAETKADLLKWMVGTIGLQTVVILGAVVAFTRVMAH